MKHAICFLDLGEIRLIHRVLGCQKKRVVLLLDWNNEISLKIVEITLGDKRGNRMSGLGKIHKFGLIDHGQSIAKFFTLHHEVLHQHRLDIPFLLGRNHHGTFHFLPGDDFPFYKFLISERYLFAGLIMVVKGNTQRFCEFRYASFIVSIKFQSVTTIYELNHPQQILLVNNWCGQYLPGNAATFFIPAPVKRECRMYSFQPLGIVYIRDIQSFLGIGDKADYGFPVYVRPDFPKCLPRQQHPGDQLMFFGIHQKYGRHLDIVHLENLIA